MNAITYDFTPASEQVKKTSLLNDAHIARSKIIDKCSEVERWMIDVIKKHEEPGHLLGIRIEQLKKIIKNAPNTFKNSDKLMSCIDAFVPYSNFRSEIAHSTIQIISSSEDINYVLFNSASSGSNKLSTKAIILSQDQLKATWKEMCAAANALTNFALNPPSSQPQQKQGAAAGP